MAKLKTNVKSLSTVCALLFALFRLLLLLSFIDFISFWFILSLPIQCLGQPKIRKSLTDVEVTEKENLQLEVEVYAVPEPKITWFRDGQEVRSDARIKIQRDNVRSETYNLTLNMIKRDEAGVYEMKATNTLGTAVTKSVVVVNSEYKVHPFGGFSLVVVSFNILPNFNVSCVDIRARKISTK